MRKRNIIIGAITGAVVVLIVVLLVVVGRPAPGRVTVGCKGFT